MTSQASTPVVRSLRGIAPLIGDLVTQVAGLRSKPDADGSGYAKALEAPLPLNATAFDDANELFMHLANEVIYDAAWLDEVPPVIDAWRSETGTVIGLRAGTTAAHAHAAASTLATWLEDRLEQLPEHAIDGLLHEVRAIAKRHPFRDRAALSTTAVCPDCAGALRVHPPRHLGDEQTAECLACHVVIPEAEYQRCEYRYAGILAAEKRKARANAVRDRLARKYLGTVTRAVA